MENNTPLARTINLPLLTLYGLGTILGAGIYVLIGKVAGQAGLLAPMAFIVAAVIAWVTALSYSQLAAILPKSAGEAYYVDQAFNRQQLTLLVGLLIILTGIVSAATLTNGFIGYLSLFLDINRTLGIILVIVVLTTIACWGISESLIVSGLITIIEIFGIVLVIGLNTDVLSGLMFSTTEINFSDLFIPHSTAALIGIFSGAFLVFYAFIGFEDMVNIVEEVKEPQKNLPIAIILAIAVSSLLYIAIALIAVVTIPISSLVESDAPLTLLIEEKTTSGTQLLGLIGLFAIINGVLVQMIMASRVIYGLSQKFDRFAFVAWVNPKTQTPIFATGIASLLILGFALFLPIATLAKITSFIILIIFSLVNIALWSLKRSTTIPESIKVRNYPIIGTLLCIFLLLFQYVSFLSSN